MKMMAKFSLKIDLLLPFRVGIFRKEQNLPLRPREDARTKLEIEPDRLHGGDRSENLTHILPLFVREAETAHWSFPENLKKKHI